MKILLIYLLFVLTNFSFAQVQLNDVEKKNLKDLRARTIENKDLDCQTDLENTHVLKLIDESCSQKAKYICVTQLVCKPSQRALNRIADAMARAATARDRSISFGTCLVKETCPADPLECAVKEDNVSLLQSGGAAVPQNEPTTTK